MNGKTSVRISHTLRYFNLSATTRKSPQCAAASQPGQIYPFRYDSLNFLEVNVVEVWSIENTAIALPGSVTGWREIFAPKALSIHVIRGFGQYANAHCSRSRVTPRFGWRSHNLRTMCYSVSVTANGRLIMSPYYITTECIITSCVTIVLLFRAEMSDSESERIRLIVKQCLC